MRPFLKKIGHYFRNHKGVVIIVTAALLLELFLSFNTITLKTCLKMTGEGMVADIRHALTKYSLDGVHFHTTIYPEFVCTVCD